MLMVLNPKTKKVGCALFQAMFGGEISMCHMFDVWETGNPQGMVKVEGTPEQWKTLAANWNAFHKRRSR